MSKRELGLVGATTLVVGSQIGSGVFLLPASLAPFGWGAVVGTLISAAGAMVLAAVFARLAVALPLPGGPFAYARAAFGDAAGFAVGWTYWLMIWVGNAALAVAAVGYVIRLAPGLGSGPATTTAVSVAIIWLFTLVNLAGTRTAGLVQSVTTVLKLIPLAAVIGVGAFIVARDGSAVLASPAPVPAGFDAVAGAVTLTMWAFLGIEVACVPAGRVADPRRTIPLATIGGTLLTAIVTLGIVAAVVLTLPAVPLAADPAPLSSFVAHWTDGGAVDWGLIVAVAALISALGAMNGWVLVQGETPAALAEDGLFPPALARRSADGTPGAALLLSAVLVTGILLMNAGSGTVELFGFIAEVSVLAALAAYAASAIAALKLARDGRLEAGAGFRLLCVLALVFSLGALLVAGGRELVWLGVMLVAGLPVWWWVRRGGATFPRGNIEL